MSVSIRVTANSTPQLLALLNRLAVAGVPDEILERFDSMSGSIDSAIEELKANLARLEAVEDRVQAFAESVPAMIAQAIADAKDEGATEAQLASLNELNARLTNEIGELAAHAGASDAAEPVEPEPAPVEPAPVDPAPTPDPVVTPEPAPAPDVAPPAPAPADGTVPVEPVPDQPGNTVPPTPNPGA